MKKILAFRTDRLGDFIITKQSLNFFLENKDRYEVDIVVSPKNYDYIKNFKSINKTYIFKGSYIKFFIKNFDILKKKYDYLILYDGKKRSHIISFFLRGKKISLSKSKILFKIAKFFKYISILNSNSTVQLDNFNFVNLLLDEENAKKNIKKNNFYFDYVFERLNFNLPLSEKKNLILHLDEKWFKGYYYHDFDYCDWDNEFFYKLIKKLLNKFQLPIIITTGSERISFLELIKKDFINLKKNIFENKNYRDKLFLIDDLSFRELEAVFKTYAERVFCCEGGVSHISHNLNIKTIALIQSGRDMFYKHWTGHMNNIVLIKRGSQKHLLDTLDKVN